MKLLNNSEYGAVSISKQVIEKLVLDELLIYEDIVSSCSPNGKVLKRGFFTGLNELLSSVEVHDSDEGMKIVYYIIVKFGESINEISNAIFDGIEQNLEMFHLSKPIEIKAYIKGVQAEHISKRNIEVIRTNE